MRHFTIAAATVVVAALISAAPASAERINGGPIKQNGQCWTGHGGASEATWGYWEACAAKASRGGRGGAGAVGPQATTRRRT
jgi:opacity protein-like surface antigen